MDRRRLKFLLLGTGVLLSMTFLIVVGMNRPGGMVYYLTVTEFMALEHREGDSRVNGAVIPGTIERMPTGMDARFLMSDGSTTIPVSYHGIIPDTFVDEAPVVVEGRLQEDGTFVAHTLLAKCPSKYEAAEDGAGDARDAAVEG